jgi:Mrp family chromosome partitioning ATPase
MSNIFDALRKSEAERSGLHLEDFGATELLQVAERESATERDSVSESRKPAGQMETEFSSISQSEVLLQPLQQETEREDFEFEPLRLEIQEKQRDELMKFTQHVFLIPETKAPRTVVLTSPEPGDGCSWICCRASEILASQIKEPICLVDANLYSPVLHQIFGVDNHYGLSDALESAEPIRSFLRPLGGPNLWLLCSGGAASNHRRLLNPNAVRGRLAELCQYFKFVLIDSPALGLGSDAIVLGQAAEGVLLVLKANSSRRDSARKAVQDLQNAGGRVLGAVLNQRTLPIPQAIYDKL